MKNRIPEIINKIIRISERASELARSFWLFA